MNIKLNIIFCLLPLLVFPLLIKGKEPSLIVNMENQKVLPRNFRTTVDPYKNQNATPSKKGLSELHASASGQFSENAFNKIKEHIPAENIFVIDLREESHGFINGMAISWYQHDYNWGNKSKSLSEILEDEKQRVKQASLKKTINIYKKDSKPGDSPLIIKVEDTFTESEFVESLGFQYARIPITDHLKPENEKVDQFIDLVKNKIGHNSSDYWIHFHCSAGRGRATTFLTLYDMIRNAKEVSLEDILARQALIGGKDLSESFKPTDWRYYHDLDRQEFLQNFYYYCQENPNLEQSWSSWISKQS